MSSVRLALVLVNGLLLVVLVLRLVGLKRQINGYRPPSPLPRRRDLVLGLTITRVS